MNHLFGLIQDVPPTQKIYNSTYDRDGKTQCQYQDTYEEDENNDEVKAVTTRDDVGTTNAYNAWWRAQVVERLTTKQAHMDLEAKLKEEEDPLYMCVQQRCRSPQKGTMGTLVDMLIPIIVEVDA